MPRKALVQDGRLIEITPIKDEWCGLAVLLANLIEKYASELDIDHMPNPRQDHGTTQADANKTSSNLSKSIIEKDDAA